MKHRHITSLLIAPLLALLLAPLAALRAAKPAMAGRIIWASSIWGDTPKDSALAAFGKPEPVKTGRP